MRKGSAINWFYLALLVLELVVLTYDGLFTDASFGQWVRISVLALAILGFYCWAGRLWASWKWAWRAIFLLVCGWFLVYLPLEL